MAVAGSFPQGNFRLPFFFAHFARPAGLSEFAFEVRGYTCMFGHFEVDTPTALSADFSGLTAGDLSVHGRD